MMQWLWNVIIKETNVTSLANFEVMIIDKQKNYGTHK